MRTWETKIVNLEECVYKIRKKKKLLQVYAVFHISFPNFYFNLVYDFIKKSISFYFFMFFLSLLGVQRGLAIHRKAIEI